jgi:ADP-L-glycero-D-manno-heptose 6-epimerase
MDINYEYSKKLLHFSIKNKIQFIYASSAATYGNNTTFVEDKDNEAPINMYGSSKYLFDQYVRRRLKISPQSQIVGMRYFNVYGPRESHKGSMASVAFHQYNQMKSNQREHSREIKLFEGCDGYGDGEQRRDFIYVDDVVDVNLWMYQHPEVSGIFNVGTGRSQPFNDVANAVITFFKENEKGQYAHGKINYIPFPEHLKGHYQSFTEANISRLREAGYQKPFLTVEQGVRKYFDFLSTAE